MTHPVAWGLFEIGFGLLLMVHCPRAALREYRSGIAIGRWGLYPRASRPLEFWAVVGLTALAGVLGGALILGGIATTRWG